MLASLLIDEWGNKSSDRVMIEQFCALRTLPKSYKSSYVKLKK